jgi:type I restriction enzyme M protein
LTTDDSMLDRLVTRTEMAGLAEVGLSAISQWSKRHADFPQPVRAGNFFRLADVVEWLDRRQILPANRLPGEPAGYTYGDRVRRNAARSYSGIKEGGPEPPDDYQQQALDYLLSSSVISAGGGADSAITGYLTLLLCLVFLRRSASGQWAELNSWVESGAERLGTAAILKRIGDNTDEALRAYGIDPGVGSAFEQIQPRSVKDLKSVVRRCGHLGTVAFEQLLDRFAVESRFGTSDYFTPPEVALLMANLVAGESSEDLPIYDPYLRGGELLRAVMTVRPDVPRVALRGESPNLDTLRFAGMSLVILGQSAEIRQESIPPWAVQGKRRNFAGAVLVNPPFKESAARPVSDGAWLFGEPSPGNAGFSWIQYAIACCAPTASAAILMPRHVGASSDHAQRKICEEMAEKGAIEAIIMLPSGLFPSSAADVNLWVVKQPTEVAKPVIFVDCTEMFSRSRTRKVLTYSAVDRISKIYRERHVLEQGKQVPFPEGGRVVKAGMADIRETGYSLNPYAYIKAGPGSGPPANDETVRGAVGALIEQRLEVIQLGVFIQDLRLHAGPGVGSELPAGWKQLPLDMLCDIQVGPSPQNADIKKRNEDGSIPVVMPKHLRDGRIVADGAAGVSREVASKLDDKYRLCADDILCIRTGAMAEPAIAQRVHNGWLFGSNLFRLRVTDPDLVDAGYLLGYLSLPEVREWMRSQSASTAQPTLSKSSLERRVITLPPLAEQQSIGSVLRSFDDLMRANREFIVTAAEVRKVFAESLVQGITKIRLLPRMWRCAIGLYFLAQRQGPC